MPELTLNSLAQSLSPNLYRTIWIAFSGGPDSTALLHLAAKWCKKNQQACTALHINHGIQQAANAWQTHCENVCLELGIAIVCKQLDQQPTNSSMEAWAHEQRMRIFNEITGPEDALLLAHHADDQAETLLLNLLRGSGPLGLAAMPGKRLLANGCTLIRPLLQIPGDALKKYTAEQALSTIDDPSNEDRRFDRNFLRHEVLPMVQQRWPSAAKTLCRAAKWQGEMHDFIQPEIEHRLATLIGHDHKQFPLNELTEYSPIWQKNLLRTWLAQCTGQIVSNKQLNTLLNDVILAKPDGEPEMHLKSGILRRYRDCLYWLSNPQPANKFNGLWQDLNQDFQLPNGQRIPQSWLNQAIKDCAAGTDTRGLQVSWPPPNNKITRMGENSIRLKKIFQQEAIPPWQRKTIPIIHLDEQILAIYPIFQLKNP